MATIATRGPGERTVVRRVSAFLYRHRRAQLALTLGPPVAWMLVVYLAALLLLLVTSFWRVNPLTSSIERVWSLGNYRELVTESIFRTIALRTLGMAAAVALTDVVLAFPVAYYAARIATPRARAGILLAVVLPLWSSYLVRVFAWRTILEGGGPAESFLRLIGLGGFRVTFSNWAVWITFTYLWLPFVVLPIFAAIERIPSSLLEASSDFGAKAPTTFRRVIWPLAFPGVVAGSIFAFSLTLGDYIAPNLVGNTQFIGNVISEKVGTVGDLPFAAAFAMVPVAIMAVYLTVARRLGAFEAL
ncbi:MAG: ABC transporter permease [Actinomycetota bacterium]|nr:ABC transporter permease [Actinomycetota bacterium]